MAADQNPGHGNCSRSILSMSKQLLSSTGVDRFRPDDRIADRRKLILALFIRPSEGLRRSGRPRK